MMDSGDLMLVGSSPPTYRGTTPAPSSTRIQTPTHYPGDSGRLETYFDQNGRGSTQQQRAATNTRTQTLSSGYKAKKSAFPSDGGMMSSSRSSEVEWQRPAWGSNAGNHAAFDKATRYNINRYDQTRSVSQMSLNQDEHYDDTRPQSRASQSKANMSRPASAKKNNFKPSYVDDMLFGSKLAEPDFSAPWNSSTPGKHSGVDYKNYKNRGSSRPGSGTHVPRHSATYVDESLFGPKPVDAGWEAPWSKPETKRIHTFDEFQHKLTIEHRDVEVVRPSSSVYMRKPRPVSGGKPVWR